MAPVNYSFLAADEFSRAIEQAKGKLDALVTLRKVQRSKLLSKPDSQNWSGKRRDRFEQEFVPEQRALGDLIGNLFQLKKAVDAATTAANAARKGAR